MLEEGVPPLGLEEEEELEWGGVAAEEEEGEGVLGVLGVKGLTPQGVLPLPRRRATCLQTVCFWCRCACP